MKNRVFAKVDLSFPVGTTKEWLREHISPLAVKTAIDNLEDEKRSRIESGEAFTLIVKVGTRKRLLKWKFDPLKSIGYCEAAKTSWC